MNSECTGSVCPQTSSTVAGILPEPLLSNYLGRRKPCRNPFPHQLEQPGEGQERLVFEEFSSFTSAYSGKKHKEVFATNLVVLVKLSWIICPLN